MPQGSTHPLTDQHLTLINNGLRAIVDARRTMQKATAAGMPMDAHEQTADQMEALLSGFKQQFFGLKTKGS